MRVPFNYHINADKKNNIFLENIPENMTNKVLKQTLFN